MHKNNMICSINGDKKEKLILTIKKNRIRLSNRVLILSLIESGKLDSIINEINEDCVKVISSPLIPDGYLTGYEQFICVLDKFTSYVLDLIDSPQLIESVILNCIKDSRIFLSKRYVYDADNIEYYKFNYNYLIVNIFYRNLLKMKRDLSDDLNLINLNIKMKDVLDKEEAEYLVGILSEIVFINKNDYKVMSLFTSISENRYELFLGWYKMLFSKYIRNMNFINIYREFKKDNS